MEFEAGSQHCQDIADRGIELEIIAVPDDRNPETLAVIHAMPTEFKGQGDSEEE